jgi:hypothetical protein
MRPEHYDVVVIGGGQAVAAGLGEREARRTIASGLSAGLLSPRAARAS